MWLRRRSAAARREAGEGGSTTARRKTFGSKAGREQAADDLTTPPLLNLSVLLKTLAARATSRRGCSTAGGHVRGGALSTAVFHSELACLHARAGDRGSVCPHIPNQGIPCPQIMHVTPLLIKTIFENSTYSVHLTDASSQDEPHLVTGLAFLQKDVGRPAGGKDHLEHRGLRPSVALGVLHLTQRKPTRIKPSSQSNQTQQARREKATKTSKSMDEDR